jgi:hypothetical protein
LDISPVDTKIPLHNRMINPVKATAIKSLVRVRNINTAFHGGNLARADFQFTPPFGSIMANLERGEKGRKRRASSERRIYRGCIASVESQQLNECTVCPDQKEEASRTGGGLNQESENRKGGATALERRKRG